MAEGTVVRFDAERGEGVIEPRHGGEPLWFDVTAVRGDGRVRLQVGGRVVFEVAVGPAGRRAVGVTPVDGDAPR